MNHYSFIRVKCTTGVSSGIISRITLPNPSSHTPVFQHTASAEYGSCHAEGSFACIQNYGLLLMPSM